MDAHQNSHNASSDTSWMNGLRALAVVGVVIHHWFLFVPFGGTDQIIGSLAGLVRDVGGTALHLFFLLSGCGLTISRLRQEDFRLGKWARRRFEKIVLPYWAVIICTFCLANLVLYSTGNSEKGYSWGSLLSYLTFASNHYQTAWEMNPTLWFMPVIVGLYIFFPFLVKVLKKYGAMVLLIFTGVVTYGSIVIFRFFDYDIEHMTAVFLFFVLEFAMGMVLGYLTVIHPRELPPHAWGKGFHFGSRPLRFLLPDDQAF